MPDKTPASAMIRVPTALIPTVKKLSKLHREGHTQALGGLEKLISTILSETDSKLDTSKQSVPDSKLMSEILTRLERLEDVVFRDDSKPDSTQSQVAISAAQNPLEQDSNSQADVLKPTSSASVAFLPASRPALQGKQQLDQSGPSKDEWNVYLHHPRGTVEQVAGPFPDQEQAQSEINSQMEFGLFPESKGYRWECREEPKGTAAS